MNSWSTEIQRKILAKMCEERSARGSLSRLLLMSPKFLPSFTLSLSFSISVHPFFLTLEFSKSQSLFPLSVNPHFHLFQNFLFNLLFLFQSLPLRFPFSVPPSAVFLSLFLPPLNFPTSTNLIS